MAKELLNQTQFAAKMGVKRQRIGQILASGELMTEKIGARTLIVDNKFNSDVVAWLTHGSGNWNRPRNG